jgi:hypothetical protein
MMQQLRKGRRAMDVLISAVTLAVLASCGCGHGRTEQVDGVNRKAAAPNESARDSLRQWPTMSGGVEASGAEDANKVLRFLGTGSDKSEDVLDATTSYPWVGRGRVFFVGNLRTERLRIVVSTPGGLVVCLSCSKNLDAIARFVSEQFSGAFPFETQTHNLATFLTGITVDPRSLVALKERLAIERRNGLEDWLQGREKDRGVFESLWTDINMETNGNNWCMKFNVFELKGGVKSIETCGTAAPFGIRKLNVHQLKPDGEFSFALVG